MAIITGQTFTNEILKGIERGYRAIVPSYGPSARNVVIDKDGKPYFTKDGATIIESLFWKEPIQDTGLKLLQETCHKTMVETGDGTSLTAILSYHLYKELHKLDIAGFNVNELTSTLADVKNEVIQKLYDRKEIIRSEKDLYHVVFNSCRDDELAKSIVDAYGYVGNNGIITIEEGKNVSNEVKFTEGYHFSRGLIRQYFANRGDNVCELENPYVLVYNGLITETKEIQPIVSKVNRENRSLFILAKDVFGNALEFLTANVKEGNIKVNAIRPPEYGDVAYHYLIDIAKVTGAKVINPEIGHDIKKITIDDLGSAKRIVSNKEATTIYEGQGEDNIEDHIQALQRALIETTDNDHKKVLQDRITMLDGGIATIFIGGQTESEIIERKMRAEDAIASMRSSVKYGIIPSVAMVLYEIGKEMKEDDNTIKKSISKAFEAPIRILYENNYMDYRDVLPGLKEGKGFDFNQGKIVDMRKKELIDSAKVLEDALENSVSMVVTLIRGQVGVIGGKGK